MVERQVDGVANLDPGRLGCVVPAFLRLVFARPDNRRVGQRDGPAARVAAGLGEEADRLDRTGDLQPGFLAQLAAGTASAGSSISRKPPGIAHLPANGSRPRRIRSTRSDCSTREKTARSTVTIGRGYS